MSQIELPIQSQLADILKSVEDHPSVVLQAEPGAGKSTVLPLALLHAECLAGQRILLLEPRRVAAKTIAHYLAYQLGEPVGQTVGYRVRNDRKVSNNTRLEIVTEGILTRQLLADPELPGVGLIIFDEFHERSLQADLALMLALEVQTALRDDLKLLIMSATINTSWIANYLGGPENVGVIQCPGRAHPVTVDYLQAPKHWDLPEAVARAVSQALAATASGDILVFLPGQREIERSFEAALRRTTGDSIEFLKLFGGLSIAEQERVLTPSESIKRRVIFSTNVAETSLTIPGVIAVIDSGLERRLRYDPGSDMTRLETVRISKASAAQRMGRAGRLGPGQCWRLWSEQDQQQLVDYQPPEILETDLASAVLDLLSWGFTDYDSTPWLTPPPRQHYEAALETLGRLDLVTRADSSAGFQVTTLAHQLEGLGVHPRIGAMLMSATSTLKHGLLSPAAQTPEATGLGLALACRLAALLNDRDIFVRGHGVDLDKRLLALLDYEQDRKSALGQHPLHRSTVAEALATAKTLERKLDGSIPGETPPKSAVGSTYIDELLNKRHEWLAHLLLAAYPDRLGKQRGDSLRYLLANGKGVTLPEGDALTGSEWLVVVDWDGRQSDGVIFSAVALAPSEALAFAGLHREIRSELRVSDDGKKLSRRPLQYYGSILINQGNAEPLEGDELIQHLPALFRERGLNLLNWTAACDQWLGRAQWLSQQIPDFPLLDETVLASTADAWLLPYVGRLASLADLKRVAVLELLRAVLTYEQQQQLEREAPAEYQAPSGKHAPIRYAVDQPPTVSLPLQELFGEHTSPMLGGGTTPLRFELLSPARRPIQTTSDLAGFWRTSYFEVAKEMRGRYPKHRWPDKPLEERPGKSLKR